MQINNYNLSMAMFGTWNWKDFPYSVFAVLNFPISSKDSVQLFAGHQQSIANVSDQFAKLDCNVI